MAGRVHHIQSKCSSICRYIYFSSSMFVYFTHMPLLCVYIYMYIYINICVYCHGKKPCSVCAGSPGLHCVGQNNLAGCVREVVQIREGGAFGAERLQEAAHKDFLGRHASALHPGEAMQGPKQYIYICVCVQRVGSCYILCRIYIYIYHILWMDQMLHHCDSYTVYRRLSQGFLVPTGAVFHPSTGCLYEWRMFATLCRHTRTYPSMCIYLYIYMFVC